MTNEDRAWLAGFWEGEGCAGIYSRGKNVKRALVVEIAQKNPAVLYWIKAQVGYGCVHMTDKKTGVFHWKIHGSKAKKFLLEIFPYLKSRQSQVLSFIR